jgi:phosphoenolpyruvate carboxykinase (GTP)
LKRLYDWVARQVALCRPAHVHFCDGSDREFDYLAAMMVAEGKLVPLKKRPRSFWCHSHPDDVARVEESTCICCPHQEDAGPTNNWCGAPEQVKETLRGLFEGCMRGRTLYVVPYCMGPFGSKMARFGVELTDSPYVVLNMKLMTRMGKEALDHLGDGEFVPGLHSVGVPLKEGERDVPWPCNPKQRIIAHFTDERSIVSYGSGYGGNALLAKKCFSLRIASVMGRDEGWLAEHMLILGLTNPQGEKRYIVAAFPSACGKTNLAMISPSLPGWKIECVGDDIAWMHLGADGRLYAMNPEAGFFGIAPGTSFQTNPHGMKTIEHDTIFTNVALTPDGDVWWEGMGTEAPPGLVSWLGTPFDPEKQKTAAYPNGRFTVSMRQSPILSPSVDDPQGVPISAILFGGRRDRVMPLVVEAFDWNHGVFFGASLSSQTTAAAKGEVGKLRHDPFAMLPFCGYHMGDYFAHWIRMGQRSTPERLPKIYAVNWFRRGKDGSYLWPGYGENIRVLEWIFERTSGRAQGEASPIGILPPAGAIQCDANLFAVEREEWMQEVDELRQYFTVFGSRFPREMQQQLEGVAQRVSQR